MTQDRRLRQGRIAVLFVFFASGVTLGNWAPYVPLVQERLGLSAGALGLALLAMGAGAFVGMPITGRLVDRFGSRSLTSVTTLLLCLFLPLPILAPSMTWLVASLLVFGGLIGGMDVAMNVQAAGLEKEWGRPTMSLFHAFYSLGGLVGAGAGGLLVEARIDPREHVFGLSAVLAVLGVMFLSRLHSTTTQPSTRGSRWEELRGPVAGLGALAFLVFGSEGAMLDWSAAYLKNSLAAGPGLAAAGYAVFSLMMAVGRLCGDWAVARIGTGRLARSSGWLAAGGTVLAIVAGRPETAIVGFGLVGLGLSNIVPVLFSAAARAPGAPSGPAIAAVATVGYAGLLAAPPAIGFVAEAATLRAGLVLVLAAIVLVSLRIRASVEAELIRSRA